MGIAQDLSSTGVELPELRTAGLWDNPTMPARYTIPLDEARCKNAYSSFHQMTLGETLGLKPDSSTQ